jgi:hypothetical protein
MESSSSASLLGSASPSPSPGLFFQSPAEPETPAPRSSPETVGEGSSPHLLDEPGSASATGWPLDDEPDELSDSDPTSSGASSRADAPPKIATRAALRETTRQAVIIGSGMAHRFGTRTDGQRAVGLYLADDEDADNIANPLSGILHRHGGVVGGAMTADAQEGVQVLLALGGYVSKQIVKAGQAREVDEHLAGGGTLDGLTA